MRKGIEHLLRVADAPDPERAEVLWAEYQAGGAGADAAFTTLLAWYGRAVYRRIWGFVRSDAADDVFQDVLAALHRDRQKLATFADALRWLRTVAVSRCVDAHRRATRRKAREQAHAVPVESTPVGERLDLNDALRVALAKLSPREQQAVALVFFEGMTRQDAAAVAGVHRDTFAKTIDAALAKLRSAMTVAALLGAAATTAHLEAALTVRSHAAVTRLTELAAAAWARPATSGPRVGPWLVRSKLLVGLVAGGVVMVSLALVTGSLLMPATAKPTARLGVERLEARDNPAGGVLDPTFGTDGKVTLPFDGGVPATAAQPDGKVLTVSGNRVVRLNANGSTDTSFGQNGMATLTGMGGQAVVLQPDGKIVVGGNVYARNTRWGSSDAQYAVARLNPNGTLDTTFGNNRGFWLANPTTRDEWIRQVAVVPSGGSFSIFVGAAAPTADGSVGFAAVKLTAAGQPDPTFGSGGFAVRRVGANGDAVSDLAVLPTGRVVLSGNLAGGGGPGVLVAFTPAGQPDAGFDGDGVAYLSVPGAAAHPTVPGATITLVSGIAGAGLAVQGSNLLVAGNFRGADGVGRGFMMRYTPAGTPDPTFGIEGVFVGPGGTAAYNASMFRDVQVAADGTIGLSGSSNKLENGVSSPAVLIGRLSADGQPDTTFGPAPDGTGLVAHYNLIPRNSTGAWPTYLYRLTLDADGNFLMGAAAPPQSTSVGQRPVVMRFTGD